MFLYVVRFCFLRLNFICKIRFNLNVKTCHRLRLQEEFRPLSVGGKVFSCFRMLNMSLKTSSDEEDSEQVTCLLQYVITVDDDCMSAEKKDQRKISSDFTTEVNILQVVSYFLLCYH